MKRREFMKGGLFGATTLLTSGISGAAEKKAVSKLPKPQLNKAGGKNIVFISADQLAAAFLGCYGSGVDSTPTLDRLAAKGVRFERFYASCPVCAPNRAIWLTGRSPVVNGIITNNYNHVTDSPTYAQVLRANGYRTGAFGKMHQTPMPLPVPENVEFLGFDESVVSEDPKWGPWIDWIEKEHPEHLETALAMCWPRWHIPKRQEKYIARAKAARRKIIRPLRTSSEWKNMYTSPLPAELHDSTFITNVGLDFIQRHIRNHKDKPFLCHISYVDPHDPYDPPEPYASMYKPDDMKNASPAEWYKKGNPILDRSRDSNNFRKICDNPSAIRKWRALYHGSLKFLDDQIARIDEFLEKNNLWKDTILVFTTDHGDMMGDQALHAKGNKHYDKGIRCPLIVCGGGIGPQVSNRLGCSLDFYPTFCDWAGIDKKDLPPLEGKSFAKTCRAEPEKDHWQEIAVILGPVLSVITDDGWRLTRFVSKIEAENTGQMFNLKKDPDEQHDLYDDPVYNDKKQELLERLVKVSTRPHRIAQYRNMSLINGKKYYIQRDKLMGGSPLYERRSAGPAK